MTDLQSRQTMDRMVRCGRSLASLLVVVGILTSTWATCVEGAAATVMQQMACCKAGHDHCPMKASAADCCQQSGPQIQSQATVVKAASIHAPVRTVLAWLAVPALSSVPPIQPRVSFESSPPDSRVRPPAYILFSILLI